MADISVSVFNILKIPFTGCGVNPARSFGPAVVVCMSGADCSAVMGDWYWIYFVGPFLAAFLVAEATTWMEMDVGDAEGNEISTKETDKTFEEPASP